MSALLATASVPAAPAQVIFFVVVALLSVVGALGVVVARDPFVSALSLILNFGALGTLYLSLHAPFVAVAQVIVYAGAVIVLFLFVIAYLGDRRELMNTGRRTIMFLPLAVLSAAVLLGLVLAVVWNGFAKHSVPGFPNHIAATFGSVESVGTSFMTTYTLEFEAVSMVLLVAAIGGVTLGLTGRARHNRLRRELGTRSSDQQKRLFADTNPEGADYERARASREIASHGYRERFAQDSQQTGEQEAEV